MAKDDVQLLPVEFNDVAILPFDIGAAHKWRIFAQRLPGPSQHVKFFRFAQIIDVSGVHIHGVHQSGAVRGSQMILKSFDGHSPIRLERQERRRDALHLAAKLLPLNDGFDFHCFVFAIFNRSASSEFL